MPKEELSQIIRELRDESTRWDAILKLKLLNNPILTGELIHYLQDKDWIVRWCVAEKLGDLSEPVAIPHLINCLNDSDFHVRKNTAKALTKFGPSIIEPLSQLLENKQATLRKMSHAIIIAIGKEGLRELESLLSSTSWVTANHVLYCIYYIAKADAEAILIRSLSNKNIQKQAILFLGELKSTKAIPYLIQLYFQPQLKKCVLESFKRIGNDAVCKRTAQSWLSKQPRIQAASEKLILKLGPAMIPHILDILSGPHSQSLMDNAVKLIEKLGPEKHINAIIKYANKNKSFKHSAADLLKKYPPSPPSYPDSKKKFLGLV